MKNKFFLFLYFATFLNFSAVANSIFKDSPIVHTVKEFNDAVAKAKPGSVIVLANGVWNNAELLFEAEGTAYNPITLTAE